MKGSNKLHQDGFVHVYLMCIKKRRQTGVWWTPECFCSSQHLELQRGALVNRRGYLRIDAGRFHPAVSVPVGLSVSVCDLGTLVVESRVKILGLALTSAFVSAVYQARGEDSLGLRGFSGVWVSVRALWKIKPIILSDLCSFYHRVFRLRAHLFIPLTAAICSLITLQLQADALSATLGAISSKPHHYSGFSLSNLC